MARTETWLRRLEQAHAMLELRYPQSEIVGLLAPDDPEPPHRLVGGVGRDRAEPLRLGAPARDRIAHRVAHRVALDPDPAREVVGDVVGRLGRERQPAEPGQQQLLEACAAPRCRLGSAVPVHGRSVRGRALRACEAVLAGAAVRAARAAGAAALAARRVRPVRRRGRHVGRARARAPSSSVGLGDERRRRRRRRAPPTDWTLDRAPRACAARTPARAP